MKKLIAVALAAVVTVACGSQKAPAEMAVQGLESAVAAATPEVEKFAGDQMASVNDAVAAVKAKFEGGDYAGAIADAQTATGTLTTAVSAAAAKKTELTTEWASFATMPGMVGQATAKLTELGAMRRLPAGMTRATLEEAKTSLSSVTTMWGEASDAFTSGDLMAAVAKAKDVKPMVESLMGTLGLTAAAM